MERQEGSISSLEDSRGLNDPEISVVMSTYNDAIDLGQTVESILTQESVSLEFVIVNDGSTDESPAILDEYARRDSRVRVIHQENQGLTAALIRGCAGARGSYIARQDAGDVSMPERLSKQLDSIKKRPDASLVSCGTRFVGPANEYLYEVSRDPHDATERLLTLDPAVIQGPSSHPSTMFPREAYEKVGGYRSAFYFGQDLDLWIRLAEVGEHVVLPEVLYEAAVTVQSISGLYRREQVEIARLVLASAASRRGCLNDFEILNQARRLKPSISRQQDRLQRAKALYFIGSCLRKHSNPVAAQYFQQALRSNPLHVKSALRLLLG
jgi:glycosyltransferase involved in cell wall biosynthesis